VPELKRIRQAWLGAPLRRRHWQPVTRAIIADDFCCFFGPFIVFMRSKFFLPEVFKLRGDQWEKCNANTDDPA
jgi:hypothetical protein